MVVFYKIWKKCNVIELTKYKMDLNNRKNEESSTVSRQVLINIYS